EAIRYMLDNGVNLVDTAPVYGLGHSEEIVGEAIKGYRDKIILVSKCGITRKKATGFGKDAPVRDSSKEMIIRQAEDSLQRIGTDYLDVLLIHWPDVNTPFEDTVEGLEQLKKDGKIRFAGICNFEADQIRQFYNLGGLDFAQYHFSMVENKWSDILHEYHEKGIATMAYGPLGGGILTGAFRDLPDFASDDMRLNFYPFFREPMFSKCQELLKVMDEVAAAHSVEVSQVAVNWACNHPDITTALCGVTKVRHARSNIEALNWELTQDERKLLDDAAAKALQ
ncbi:MAG: aldo/keto reductase, partial [Erysipelotrichaceae bacterium]|nr:aldo/keto reductase [Erysipelotrichaceae bacterium]